MSGPLVQAHCQDYSADPDICPILLSAQESVNNIKLLKNVKFHIFGAILCFAIGAQISSPLIKIFFQFAGGSDPVGPYPNHFVDHVGQI